MPPGIHFDVSIPLSNMETAVALLRERVATRSSEALPIVFGHLADK